MSYGSDDGQHVAGGSMNNQRRITLFKAANDPPAGVNVSRFHTEL